MDCKIVYVDNREENAPKYWCLNHRTSAMSKNGEIPTVCMSTEKEKYENIMKVDKEDIKSIEIVYPNIIKSTSLEVIVNNNKVDKIIEIDDSLLGPKDFGGLMLSKLNNINLEVAKCEYCNKYHTDNGRFAYTPHRIHLCLYCGHLFSIKEKNIGNEIPLYFDIPNIELNERILSIDDSLQIRYNLFTGEFLINEEKVGKIEKEGKILNVTEYLNEALKNEY